MREAINSSPRSQSISDTEDQNNFKTVNIKPTLKIGDTMEHNEADISDNEIEPINTLTQHEAFQEQID